LINKAATAAGFGDNSASNVMMQAAITQATVAQENVVQDTVSQE